MARKKMSFLMRLILTAVALVGAVLAVTGFTLDWVKYSIDTVLGGGTLPAYLLKDLADLNSKMEDIGGHIEGFGAMNSFAYITMILSIVSFAAVLLSKFLHLGFLRPVAGLAGILTVLSTILLIVFTAMFCSKNAGIDLGGLAKGELVWAVGPILMVIGGFLSGLCALVSYKK